VKSIFLSLSKEGICVGHRIAIDLRLEPCTIEQK
jgi:hypothetical protein